MQGLTSFLLIVLCVVAVVFVFICTVFGAKSDAMSGGSSSIRTTYKGKPGFDDFVSKITLILGFAFMGLCLFINFLQSRQ